MAVFGVGEEGFFQFPLMVKILLSVVAAMPLPKDSSKNFQKWSSRSKANKLLQDGLNNGRIDPSMKPKEVWESNAEFKKYLLASFRSAFNRKKTEMGVHLRDEGEFQKKPGSTHAPCLLLIACFVFVLLDFGR